MTGAVQTSFKPCRNMSRPERFEMSDPMVQQELNERLKLIEGMMAEGRRTTERSSWIFVLWGVAYAVALGWSAWGSDPNLAWPVTMAAAVVLTVVLAATRHKNHPGTTLGRAIGSLWMALGISMFLLFMALGASGRLTDTHVFIALACGFLGMANGASGLLLKWKKQFACAVGWWTASVAACFGSEKQAMVIFLAAIFLCLIVFGIYGMMREARVRRQRGATHA